MGFAHTADGLRIYYERHGSGRPVVLVHGSGGNHVSWWQQVSSLRQRHTVITLDLRGFGRSTSDLPEFDARAFADDVLAVLEAEDVTDAIVAGQSVGGVAALRAALRAGGRVRAVVLAHSLGGLDDPELMALAREDRAAVESIPVEERLLSPEFREAQPAKAFLFRQLGTLNVASMQSLTHVQSPGPAIADVLASGLDVTFLTGEKDVVLTERTVRRASELLAGSSLDVVPGAAHSMYWEAPHAFNEAIDRVAARLVDAQDEAEDVREGTVA